MSRVKNRVRSDVSQVFNLLIPEGKWQEYLDLLDRDGHPNRKELISLILVFAKHIEELETLNDGLDFRLELLEGKTPLKSETPAFKLRTPIDVKLDLDKVSTAETKRYYISPDDFKILETTVNPNLPETQYGKEVDPKDSTEKIVLYYKDRPVFKKWMYSLSTEPDTTKTLIFNPSKDDFICQYDGISYTTPSWVITSYPKYLADHIAKHLAIKLALEGDSKLHFEDRYNEQLKKIYVTI